MTIKNAYHGILCTQNDEPKCVFAKGANGLLARKTVKKATEQKGQSGKAFWAELNRSECVMSHGNSVAHPLSYGAFRFSFVFPTDRCPL